MVPVAHKVIHFFLVVIVPVIMIIRMMNLVKTQFNGESNLSLYSVDMGKPVDLRQCQVADQDGNERYVQLKFLHLDPTYYRSI